MQIKGTAFTSMESWAYWGEMKKMIDTFVLYYAALRSMSTRFVFIDVKMAPQFNIHLELFFFINIIYVF